MAYLDPASRRRRRSLVAQLRRVERDLARLRAYEAVPFTPAAAPPTIRPPLLGPRCLAALQARLSEDLAALETDWPLLD